MLIQQVSVPELAKGPVRTRAGVSLRPCLAPALDAMGRIPSEKVKGLVVYSFWSSRPQARASLLPLPPCPLLPQGFMEIQQ